jgi:hypothetical protein
VQRRLCIIFHGYHLQKRASVRVCGGVGAPPPTPYFPAASNSKPVKTTLNWSLSSSIVGAYGIESCYEDG